MNTIKHATSDADIIKCYKVMSELRTHLVAEDFLNTVQKMQTEGYRLAYLDNQDNIMTVAGYRIYHNLFMGKQLYVDDLVTAESARSKGFGEQMLSELRAIALHEQCQFFHLDSGTHRSAAHKFYFKQGLSIASFHFSEKL